MRYNKRLFCGQPGPVLTDSSGRPETETHKEKTMAYVITDKCVMCGKCKDACPVEAISAGDPKFTIDADKCVDCGACAGECPSEAIEPG